MNDRKLLFGILFVLHTGIQWEFLPKELRFGWAVDQSVVMLIRRHLD